MIIFELNLAEKADCLYVACSVCKILAATCSVVLVQADVF